MKPDPLDELEAKLFAAARDEQPGAELLERVLRASREADAGAPDGASLAPRPAPPRSARPAQRRGRAGWSGLGWLLAAAALGAALAWLRPFGSTGELAISAERAPRQAQPEEPDVAPRPSAPAPAPLTAVPAPATVPPVPPARAAKPEAEQARPRGVRPATQRPPESARVGEPPAPAATLATEIGLLRQAREALRQGDAARASSLLDGYDAARGTALRAEATLLRIEVLSAQGHGEQARALAQRFVAENPDSPLVDRARRLGEPGGAAPVVSP